MKVSSLLSTSKYFIVNKELIKALGTEEAIVLGELISERDYWDDREQLEDDWFYSTVENIENEIGYNEYKQRKILKSLESKGVLEVKVKGMPAKRYIRINEENLLSLLNVQFLKNSRTGSLKIKEQVPQNLRTNNNNIKLINKNNNIINNNNNNNNNNIYEFFEKNFCQLLSPIQYEKIGIWLREFNEDIIKYAVSIAVLNRKCTFAYVEGILKNWKGKGYNNLEEIKAENISKQKENTEEYNRLVEQMKGLEDYDWLNDTENA